MSEAVAAVKGHVPVLVIGGGPVGLAMGVALGRLGIPTLVIERNSSTTTHPKSRGCWVRTMEIFRQWGVADAIRSRGLPPGSDVFTYFDPVERVEYGRTNAEPESDQSPTWKSLVAQDVVEEELLKKLRADAVAEVRFGTEFVSLADRGSHAVVRVRDVATGSIEDWSTDWVVAADGAGSPTRRAVGLEMIGPAVLGTMINEYVRVDISDLSFARGSAGIFRRPPRFWHPGHRCP